MIKQNKNEAMSKLNLTCGRLHTIQLYVCKLYVRVSTANWNKLIVIAHILCVVDCCKNMFGIRLNRKKNEKLLYYIPFVLINEQSKCTN